ncbi:hypothetical protein [Hathewaya limosa]|uniref:Repeat protein (TIGR01451 family) n=1 Tax=Hathewaya limosa TaxID=1536 RepID=A0ABU0JQU2_HATLI|nr:hypothetical protein [Hathewaya limosa]MDQ0479464.1 putative repeat protein (TIGR01451 family) [Hathewaya limosa]
MNNNIEIDRNAVKPGSSLTLDTLVSPISPKIGDTITYIIQITIPKGVLAGNIQLKDTFPETKQQFIAGSILVNGQPMGVEPIPARGVLTFPVVSTIDATTKEVTEIYSFDVRIVNAIESGDFIDKQINTAEVTWDNNTTGATNIVVSSENNVNVTMPFIQIRKFQNNVTKATGNTIEDINFISTDTLTYKISVTNTGLNVAYNVTVADIISNYLSIDTVSLNATKGTGSFVGNTLTWNITTLEVGESVIIGFNVTGGNSIPAVNNVQNTANVTYSTNNNGFGKNLTPRTSNLVTLNINNLNLSITSSKTNDLLEDTIQYTVIFSVYKGTVLDDAQLKSIIPNSQEYISGSATKQINNNLPEVVVPSINSTATEQQLIFPKPIIGSNNNIDASKQNITIKYIFSSKVINVIQVYPYVEDQTIKSSVNWSEGSSINNEINANVLIKLKSSDISITQEQMNFTSIKKYTTGDISATIGDIIYYKITIKSKGAVGGYNLQLQDILNNNLNFLDTIKQPTLGTIVKPTGVPGGTLQWNIDFLNSETTAVYEFSVQVNSSAPLADNFSNNVVGQYSTDSVSTKVFNLSSNTLKIYTTGIYLLAKTLPSIAIGDSVLYSMKVIIPKGKTIYDLTLDIQLDLGQTYTVGSWYSSLGNAGTPSMSLGNTDIQYIESRNPISASASSDLIITYTFQTNTVYVSDLTESSKNQITTINANWRNSSGGAIMGPVSFINNIKINRPNLTCIQEQRNITKGQSTFTSDLINNASIGDELELSFSITNNGTGNAYKVVTGDNLPSWLTYVGSSTPGVGISGSRVGWDPGTINVGDTANAKITVRINALPSYPDPNYFYGNLVGASGSSITLGPIESNRIGYNYVAPEFLLSLVDENGNKILPAYIEGDIINYEFKIIVSKGTTAYNLYIARVTLPTGQTYVSNSLTSTGGVTISPSPSTLTFPNEGTVYSSTQDRIITYNFKVNVNSLASTGQERQEVETQLYWNKAPGDPITVQYGFMYEYLTPVKLGLVKTHSLNGTNFVSSSITIKRKELVYYKLEIQNPSAYPAYNVEVVDQLPPNMIMQSLENIGLSQGVLIRNGNIIGSTKLEFIIQTLSASSSITIIYTAILDGIVVAGSTISSMVTATYSTLLDRYNLVVYGPVNSMELSSTISQYGIELTKETTNTETYWDANVPYNVTVKVPQGIQLYDLQVSDKYPNGLFFVGPAYLNGTQISVTASSGKVFFPLINENAANNETILEYTYTSNVSADENVDPFEKSLENIAELSWGLSNGSSTKFTMNSSSIVIVQNPNINIQKFQRNKTDNGIFDIKQISVKSGDILEFKLVVINSGPGKGYTIECADILNNSIKYLRYISTSIGTLSYSSSNHTVNWTIDILPSNTMATAIFEVEVIGGISAFGVSTNNLSATYYGKNNPSISTQAIEQRYPPISIQLTSNKSTFLVNDIVTYNVVITVPNQMIFYNLKVQNILPIGQEFVSSTLNDISISPDVNNQLITFPVIPISRLNSHRDNIKEIKEGEEISKKELNLKNRNNGVVSVATISKAKARTFSYQIKAIVKSADMSKGIPDIQMDSANVNWSLDATNTQLVNPISDTVEVLATNNLVFIEKLQKIKTAGNFTTNDIEVTSGEEIQYNIVITNTGKIKAYNVKIEDILNDKLQYVGVDSSTQGTVNVQSVTGKNTLVWEGIVELDPGQKAELVYTVNTTSTANATISNQAISKFAITSGGDELGRTPSNEVFTNILVGNPNLVQVQKLQRINGIGNFSTNEIEISSEEEIEYKLVVTNGAMKTYKIEIQDILNDKFQYISNTTPTVGAAGIQNIGGKNVLIWNGITELNPDQSIELVFVVKGVSSVADRISNQTTSSFAVTATGANISGTPSNEVFTNILVGNQTLIRLIKFQRINNVGKFLTTDIDVSNGEEIEYKLSILNMGTIDVYKIKIEDILEKDLIFKNIKVISQGQAELQQDNNKLVWDLKDKLGPNKTAQLVYIVKTNSSITGTITNGATQSFAVTATGSILNGLPSNQVLVNILVPSKNSIKVQKIQRRNGDLQFTNKPIEINSGKLIEYKIRIENILNIKLYKVSIEDVLDNRLEYVELISVTKGICALQNNNTVVWNEINELLPGETHEAIFLVRNTSLNTGQIFNAALPSFYLTLTGERVFGELSNKVFIKLLGERYTFVPNENNYISYNQAISYTILGAESKFAYVLENNYDVPTSYNLTIGVLPIRYKLVINNRFVEDVMENTIYNGTPTMLNNVYPKSKNFIEIIYNIPKEYNFVGNEVNFDLTINLAERNDPTTIKNKIIIGQVDLLTSYNIESYPEDNRLFAIKYSIEIYISKGIKVYNLEIKSFYPPSCIFKEVTLTKELKKGGFNGEVIYPNISIIDATEKEVILNYSYTVLQYKATPLSIAELKNSYSMISFRMAKNIEQKYIIKSNAYKRSDGTKIECLYIDKVFGRCKKYYDYNDIKIPNVEGYVFEKVVFNDPQIIEKSLSIIPNKIDTKFSQIQYTFIIPYKIIYVQYNCSKTSIKEISGELSQKDLKVILYTPESSKEPFNIISKSIVDNIIINNEKTSYNVCIGIITSAIAKRKILLDTLQ